MKKALRERCKHCTLAAVRQSQNFCTAAAPLPVTQDGQNLTSWRWSLPLPTNPVSSGSMHAISSYHGNRPTKTHTHKHINKQDRLQYTVLQLASMQCKKTINRLVNCKILQPRRLADRVITKYLMHTLLVNTNKADCIRYEAVLERLQHVRHKAQVQAVHDDPCRCTADVRLTATDAAVHLSQTTVVLMVCV